MAAGTTSTVQVAIAREMAPGERRVAATPETCKKLIALGVQVRVQRGAGRAAGIVDDAYAQAGAQLLDDAEAVLAGADLVLCVQPPEPAVISRLREGTTLVGLLAPQADAARGEAIQGRGIIAFPLERLPRTTRAQAMDVLSSHAGDGIRVDRRLAAIGRHLSRPSTLDPALKATVAAMVAPWAGAPAPRRGVAPVSSVSSVA